MKGQDFVLKRILWVVALLCAVNTVVDAQAFDRDYKEKINGTTLHFRVRGESETNPYLLILHGGPGFSAHMFYPWGKSIERAVNVVYLDQRGSGESERLKIKNPLEPRTDEVKDYTVANLLADIEGVREFLKVKSWYVLGHSWGGMLGLEYVAAHPNNVIGYIMADGLLSQPLAQDALIAFAEKQLGKDAKSKDKQLKDRVERLKPFLPYAKELKPSKERLYSTMQFAFALFNEIYYADAKAGNAYNAKIQEANEFYKLSPKAIALANEPAVALMITANYAARDSTPLLAKIKVRTLVINGKQDGIIPPKTAEIVHKGIAGSKLLILDKCGHFPFAEQPEAFTKAVLEFVQAAPPMSK